ncbi:MAG: glycosyltransferase family 39 protein [Chloroflexi bacterium]|nr:glycosyltransferase family 39 protein [Chloroflexota bacterium]
MASRLYHLTILPIFLDESIHINLALKGIELNTWLASDGTRLLLIWILRALLPIASDILWSGRLVSSLVGLLAAIGCYLVGRSLFNPQSGVIAFILYTINPFMLNNDRLVMTDVYLVACAVFTVWLSIEIMKNQACWRLGPALGLTLGLAILTKLNGVMIWPLPLLAFLFFSRGEATRIGTNKPPYELPRPYLPRIIEKIRPDSFLKFPKAYLLAYGVAIIVSLPMGWLAPQGFNLIHFELNPQPSPVEAAMRPTDQSWQNLILLMTWMGEYLTPALTILTLIATVYTLKKQPRAGLMLLSWLAILALPWIFVVQPPLITASLALAGQTRLVAPALISVVQEWYPRFILPAFPALFIFLGFWLGAAGRGVTRLPQKWQLVSLLSGLPMLIFLLWPALSFDYQQWQQPELAPFSAIDRFQFIEGYPSGYGMAELVATLRAQAQQQGDIYVAMHDRVARLNAQLAVDIWRGQEKSIHLLGIRPGGRLPLAEFQAQFATITPLPPIYWVASSDNGDYKFGKDVLAQIHVEPIATFARPGDKSRIYLYRFASKSDAVTTAALIPSRPVQANFADIIELHGYDVSTHFGPLGQNLVAITLYWRALAPLAVDYTVFVHVMSLDGQRLAQHDAEPALGVVIPTTTWQPGEWIRDRHVIEVPLHLTPGAYQLRVGMYDSQTLKHLPATQNGISASDYVTLGEITLRQQP